ncbi:hypothetical protein KJ765_00565 [Candidatus Micrarchaeota archaeon]|nr:hypothetical protein [Candidatus Micrarchaeota archaeon]
MKLMTFIAVMAVWLTVTQAYSDYSYEAVIQVQPDGTAHVTEKTVFLFENNEERQEFEYKLNLGESTILEWQKFSPKIKFHMRGGIANTRITAKKEFAVSFSAGTVIIDYFVQTPLFDTKPEGSRRTIYSLNPKALAFDTTKTGETILGNNMKLTVEIPRDADLLLVAPTPDNHEGNRMEWNGPIARAWELSFAREIPLSQEVNEFFEDAFRQVQEFFPLILLVVLLLVLVFILVKYGRK